MLTSDGYGTRSLSPAHGPAADIGEPSSQSLGTVYERHVRGALTSFPPPLNSRDVQRGSLQVGALMAFLNSVGFGLLSFMSAWLR